MLRSKVLLCVVVVLASSIALAEQAVKVEKTEYGGWPNCYRMSNGNIELIVTTDIGPRIIRLGFVGKENEFKEFKDDMGKTGGDAWRPYGGHRLWHAPEIMPRTYMPDNIPVQAKVDGATISLLSEPEKDPKTGMFSGLRKEMIITLHPENHVTIMHRLHNVGFWAVECAPWALTMMAPGGRAIIPRPSYKPHGPGNFLPACCVIQWSYTDPGDPRFVWGSKYIALKQDVNTKLPNKIGVGGRETWLAYARGGNLFVKFSPYIEGATYPDAGCCIETFTNADMLETESLGPTTTIQPGQAASHLEDWFLFSGVTVTDDEATIDANVLPKIEAAQRKLGPRLVQPAKGPAAP